MEATLLSLGTGGKVARYKGALHRMHNARFDEATVKASADDLSRVLDEAMAAVRR